MPSPTRTASARRKVIAEGLQQPNGIAFKNGSLYVIAIDKALRFDGIEDKLDAPQPTDISEAIKLPPSTHHNWKFAAVGPDNKLYIAIGSPCNVCEINTGMHGLIRRQNLDGSNIEIVARGVRNSVGFDWHPQTKELWFTDNGRDWAGDDGSRGGAQPRGQQRRRRASTASPIATPRASPIPTSRSPTRASASPCRPPRSGRMPQRSACASTPATCSPPPTRTRPSSPGAARGTAPRSSAMTWCRPRSTAARPPSRRS